MTLLAADPPTCPGCGHPFVSLLGLDAHRRHLAAQPRCRYRPGERRIAYREMLFRRSTIYWTGGR